MYLLNLQFKGLLCFTGGGGEGPDAGDARPGLGARRPRLYVYVVYRRVQRHLQEAPLPGLWQGQSIGLRFLSVKPSVIVI